MAVQPNAPTKELVRNMGVQCKKLEEDHETMERMLKKSFFFLNSELGRLQADISTKFVALQQQLVDQRTTTNASHNLFFKRATARVLSRLRAKYEELLKIQREQAIDAADIQNGIAKALDDLVRQNMQNNAHLEAQYIRSTNLQKEVDEREKQIAQQIKSNKAYLEENTTLTQQVEQNGKEIQSLKNRLESCKKDATRILDEDERQRQKLVSEHANEVKLVEESAKQKERENLRELHLVEIKHMKKNHDMEISVLQQKLEDTKMVALAQQTQHDGAIRQREFQLQQSRDRSMADEAHLKKAHKEEVAKMQAELQGLSHQLSSLRSDVKNRKTAYEKLSAEHNAHADLLSEQEEKMKLAVSKTEVEAAQQRTISAKAHADLLIQLTRTKGEVEQFKGLWTQASSQIVSLKQSSSQTLAELTAKHAADIFSRERNLETRNAEVQSLASQLSAYAIAHTADINAKDTVIKQLQEQVHNQREEVSNVNPQKESVSSKRDSAEAELATASSKITQLHKDRDGLQRLLNLTKADMDQLRTDFAIEIKSLQEEIQTKSDQIKDLEAEKMVVETDVEAIKLAVEKMMAQYAMFIANHDTNLEVDLEELKDLVSRGEAKEKKQEAEIEECQEGITRFRKDRNILIEQNRSMEATMLQTCMSNDESRHPRAVLTQENEHSSENVDEEVLQRIILDCGDLRKSINKAADVLRAEQDKGRSLDAKYKDLQKEFGQSFSWKTSKHKGPSLPQ